MCFHFISFILVISPYQINTMQMFLSKLIDILIQEKLAEGSLTISPSTNKSFKSEIDFNLSTSESLGAMFNILLKQIDKQINYKVTSDISRQ